MPLKHLKPLFLTSQDTVNYMFHILFLVLSAIVFCDPVWICLFYSVLIRQLSEKRQYVEVRF